MTRELDILIPTINRPASLAITLTALSFQAYPFGVVISDQSDQTDPFGMPEMDAVLRLLRERRHEIKVLKHLPRRGMAEQRQFLLEQSDAMYVLYLDDDLILEKDMVARMMRAILDEKCGFVGSAPIGLSYAREERPWEQTIEFWDGPVLPEKIIPNGPKWSRHILHNAANIYHLQNRLDLTGSRQRKYKLAWIGGCVLYDSVKLRNCGGYDFWKSLPVEHSGEDVLVQLKVMERYGGCGLIPSGVYHLELPTKVPDRRVNAPEFLMAGYAMAAGKG